MMKPMDCTDIKALLSGLLDGELDPDTRHEAERHLAECSACRDMLDEAERRETLLTQAVASTDVPDDFEAAVLARTIVRDQTQRYWASWTNWIGWCAAAASLALAVTISQTGDRRGRPLVVHNSDSRVPLDVDTDVSTLTPAAYRSAIGRRSWTWQEPIDTDTDTDTGAASADRSAADAAGPEPRRNDIETETETDTDDADNDHAASIDDPSETLAYLISNRPAASAFINTTATRDQPRQSEPEPEPDHDPEPDFHSDPDSDAAPDDPVPVAVDDLQAIHTTAWQLELLRRASTTTFRDIEMVRKTVQYDELLNRLERVRSQLPFEDRPAVLAAESLLHRVVQGPIEMHDVRAMQDMIAGQNLDQRLHAIARDLDPRVPTDPPGPPGHTPNSL